MDSLKGKKIAVIATDGFEDSELSEPITAVKEAGGEVTVISNKSSDLTGEHGSTVAVDEVVDNVTAGDFDGLLIPGGVKNPDVMRTVEPAVAFVRGFFEQHKPVAAICHGPWLLVEADVVRGRTVTSWPSLKTDLKNAGADWTDQEVVVDQGLVTSRKPDDLPAFCAKAVEEFGEGQHAGQTAGPQE